MVEFYCLNFMYKVLFSFRNSFLCIISCPQRLCEAVILHMGVETQRVKLFASTFYYGVADPNLVLESLGSKTKFPHALHSDSWV